EHLDEDEVFVRILFRLRVGDIIDSSIMQIMPLSFAKQLVQDLLQVSETAATATVESAEAPTARQSVQQVSEEPMVKGVEEKAVTQTSQQSTVQQRTEPQLIGQAVDPGATVQQASFAELDPVDISAKGQQNLNLLLDIPLQITVELGRTKQKLEEILELTPGSIIELDKLAGEPVDVFVNSKLIAKGEVVVIDENFGVRITDIVSQKDRLLNLN
ncbi:MAG: flagellar motor switch phosphatase FliY, partial [Bacillales bacterium]